MSNNSKNYQISGIQQVGIGNTDAYATWHWYKKHLGMDLPIFDEAAEAALMLPYTAGKPRSRHAILALNHQGGGGLEIWQYTSRVAQGATFDVRLGDLGIYICKFKCIDAQKSHMQMKSGGINVLSEVVIRQDGAKHFYAQDLLGNVIEIIESNDWFRKGLHHAGGVAGVSIGVSNMNASIAFYKDVLHYDVAVVDINGRSDDIASLPGGSESFRRVVLQHSNPRKGPFSPLLGSSEIELHQANEYHGKPIFRDRMWGDLGYIHLCFDIRDMDALREYCKSYGCSFTVDSGDFEMGESAGQFAYIEDPDGTLIEFVETHKIPIVKKLNWFLNLHKRDPEKALPGWMLWAMGLSRVK
ncbi:MAG: VOC family protein [Granulosicoccus sp.]